VKKVDDVSVFKKRETMDDSATLPLTGKGLEIPGQVWKELQRPTEYVCYFMYNNKDNSKATLTVTSILSQTSSRWQLIIIHDNKLEPLDIPQNQQIEVLHSEDIGLSRAYQLAMLHCQYTLCCPVPAGIQLLPDTTQTILNSYRRGPENTFYYWAPGPADGVSASPLKNGSFKSGQALCTFRHISYYLTEGFIYEEHHQAIADLAYKLEYYCYPARLEGPLYLAGEGTANSKVSSTITCRTLQEITHLQHIALRHPATSATLQWQATKDVAMIKIGNNTYYLGHIPGKILGNNLRWVHTKGVYESVGGPGTFSLAALLDTLGPGRHINHYFDMVYVINLQKDSKKRRRMTRIFESYNIDFRFFPAIYGMQQPYYGQFLRQYTQQLWNPGAYGYTLSVINVLKDAIRNGYQRILVCDDDLILCKNFNKRFHDVIEQIPEDWQLLYFGLSGPLTPYINDGFRDYRFRVPYITDTGKCDGSFCLGYHHSVFNQVLKMALEFSGPFDTALNRYYLTEHPEIRKYVLYPYLVTADMTSSDIAPREKSIMDNYSAYQYRYRINIGNFDVDKKEQEPRQLKETFDLLRIEQEPLVTVIFYNYNQDALRSILCQTYTNLEVIVMCDNYTQRDLSEARVQIINNERPIGMVNCFRKALALSHGTYITMHHMDYRSEPERIATVLLAMQTGGLNVCATRSERDKKHFYLTGVIAKRGYTLVIENILRHLNGVLPVTVINRMLYYPAPTTTQSLCNIPQTLGRRRKTGKRR
jgi:hypothetical protein